MGSGPVVFNLDEARHGWERFGENHDHPRLGGYIEGAWLTKHAGRYYMQYAAPGTQWDTYADGVYVGDSPGSCSGSGQTSSGLSGISFPTPSRASRSGIS